jgi:hypothetical protein
VQGRLRGEYLSVTIESECADCGQPITLTVDSDLQSTVQSQGAQPMVFEPQVDWATMTDPNIIHAF